MIQTGDIIALGRHHVMCGDAACAEDVARLFGGRKAAQVFTSPPYLNQRSAHASADWTAMMTDAFSELPLLDDAQVFVNLGLIHRDYDLVEFERDWLDWMRQQGFRRSLCIWDKTFGAPGRWAGRLAPSFELVHHFQRRPREPAKITPKRPENIGNLRTGSMGRFPNGDFKPKPNPRLSLHTHKIADNVIRLPPCNSRCPHPAMFPIALPLNFILSYTQPGELVYDPFCGAGSSLLAAERTGRSALVMERDPAYCELTMRRFNAASALRGEVSEPGCTPALLPVM